MLQVSLYHHARYLNSNTIELHDSYFAVYTISYLGSLWANSSMSPILMKAGSNTF